jgi:L-lysine 6-transaminase
VNSRLDAGARPLFDTAPSEVHDRLREKLLIDGFGFVFDPVRSRGASLVDARTGHDYLDLFSFFASLPIGFNHPRMRDPVFLEKLTTIAVAKPTNSDVYTQALADFVRAFSKTLPAPQGRASPYQHLFFIEGGAVAVENALKVAFDWKVQKNLRRGLPETVGSQVAHFRHAFHGRSGYTLSLTNTADPRKTRYFPKFAWPRLPAPRLRFPATPEVIEAVAREERAAIAALEDALARNPHDIACVIIETIQGEGGDNHFRTEFLRALRTLCDEAEMLLVFDEVQCGFGITGRWWAFEHHDVWPDVFSFGKKTQVCGIAANTRCDEVDSVFKVPSRINSTWGGNLVDMVRCTRYLEIIEAERMIGNAARVGTTVLASLEAIARDFPGLVSNARGRGLMCAFDFPSTEIRDLARKTLYEERVIMLPSGDRSLRYRPVLDFTETNAALAAERIRKALGRMR